MVVRGIPGSFSSVPGFALLIITDFSLLVWRNLDHCAWTFMDKLYQKWRLLPEEGRGELSHLPVPMRKFGGSAVCPACLLGRMRGWDRGWNPSKRSEQHLDFEQQTDIMREARERGGADKASLPEPPCRCVAKVISRADYTEGGNDGWGKEFCPDCWRC